MQFAIRIAKLNAAALVLICMPSLYRRSGLAKVKLV